MVTYFTLGSSYSHSAVPQTNHLFKCTLTEPQSDGGWQGPVEITESNPPGLTLILFQKKGRRNATIIPHKNVLRAVENGGITKILNCCMGYNFIMWS